MTKKRWHEQIDYMKYLPLVVMAGGFIAGYVTLQNAQAGDSKRLDKHEAWITQQSADNTSIKISQARSEEKINAIYEAIQGLKKHD